MKNFTLFLIALILFKAGNSFSQPGTLDSSFGANGKVIKPAGSANAVAITPEGKIIAAGTSSQGFTLVRYRANGLLDRSFGVGAIATADFGDEAVVNSIVIKPSGKIIAAGTDGKNFAIAKFNVNGSLDSSFGTNGKVTTNFFGKRDEAKFVTVSGDNKILVIGTAFVPNGEQTKMVVSRYNADGTLDTSFNHDGKVTKSFNQVNFDEGYAIILQPNGKIVAIGTSFRINPTITDNDFALVRYNLNGSVDKTFGTDGYTFTDFDNLFDVPVAAGVQSDGKIIAAGYVLPVTIDHRIMELARYTKNGKLDSTFGVNGKIMTTFDGISDAAYGLIIQKDDKILVTGAGGGIEVVRFTKNGEPDISFGGDGSVNIDSTSDEFVRAITLQKNGKIIAAGSASGNFLIARLKNDIVGVTTNADDLFAAPLADAVLSNIKLYPNPANNVIYIENLQKGSVLTIYNERGDAIMQGIAGNETYTFNVQQLPAGIYYVKVSTHDTIINTAKFIKQK